MKSWLRNKALEFLGLRYVKANIDADDKRISAVSSHVKQLDADIGDLCAERQAHENRISAIESAIMPVTTAPVRKAKKGK